MGVKSGKTRLFETTSERMGCQKVLKCLFALPLFGGRKMLCREAQANKRKKEKHF